jgi:hypothetical protein
MSERFRFALENTDATHWQLFEYLASNFLSDEYGELRTLASPSGDGGRDAYLETLGREKLEQPVDDSTIALQYSTSPDWRDKVRRTVRRLQVAHPTVSWLMFASPKRIGAEADDLKRAVWTDFRVHVDVRDQNWFIEREERSPVTRAAAGRLCQVIVDPLLRQSNVIDHGGIELTSDESRAALLYLVLQRQDDSQDRGLTRLCFDAVVKALLRDTDNDHRKSRAELHQAATALFPSHESAVVCGYVDRALERLERRAVRHYNADDTWLLNYDERVKIEEGMVRLADLDQKLSDELRSSLEFVGASMRVELYFASIDSLVSRARRILEAFIYERGELFAESVSRGQVSLFGGTELEDCVNRDLLRHSDTSPIREQLPSLLAQTIERVLIEHSEPVQHFLRAIADGYTLFAFMRETPNVQSAVSKLFSQGDFWLDTTAVLPIMAERLLPSGRRSYTAVIRAAQDAGARFCVTSGVVNELSSHVDMCVQAWRNPQAWNGRTPFLLQAYIWSGSEPAQFHSWVEYFRGPSRPEDDLKLFLSEEHRIGIVDFTSELLEVEDAVRWQSEAYWRHVHERRRRPIGGGQQAQSNPETVERLAAHDSETFLGVLERRKRDDPSNPFGYTTWWLTLDNAAHRAAKEVSEAAGVAISESPVADFQFLTYYLMVGPARRQLNKDLERQLPLAFDMSLVDSLPRDLLRAAEAARGDVEGQEDRLVRRKIRDHLDAQKLGRGKTGRSGLETIRDDLRLELRGNR